MLKKIISGGQTGADRAGLDAAKFLKIKTGGYCPKGYLTETGYDLSLKTYGLKQTKSELYTERTLKNVLSGDGTVLFCRMDKNKNIIGEGTAYTYQLTLEHNKPVIINPTGKQFIKWIKDNNIKILNVAGNRESQYLGIYKKAKAALIKYIRELGLENTIVA
jgi:WD40 repeat protein